VGSGSDLDVSLQTLAIASGLASTGFNDVSCPSQQFCLAAGGGDDVNNNSSQVFSVWNGATWSAPTKAVAGDVLSASCAESTWCMLLGYVGSSQAPMSEVWTPSGLVPEQLPGASKDGLDGVTADRVSCPSEGYCLAHIGNDLFAWDGSSWTAVTLPSGQASVSDLSCGAVGRCEVLVGDGGAATEVDDVSGGIFQPTPLPGAGELDSISCPSASFCMVLGDGTWLWNGTTWSAEKGDAAVFDSEPVSCSSSFDCFGAEKAGDPGNYSPVIESYQTG
jgi:hypothetical protein